MITLAAAAAMGVWVDRVLGWPLAVWVLLALLGFWQLSRSAGLARWSWLLLIVSAALAMRSQADERRYRAASLLQVAGEDPQPAMVQGVITSLVQRRPRPGHALRPDLSPWQTHFDVEVGAIRDRQRWVVARGRLAVTIDQEAPELRSGDRVRLAGRLSAFTAPTNPGVADFRKFARNRRQHARLRVDSLSQVQVTEPAGWGLRRIADQLSRRGEATLRRCLGEQTGAIAAALVVGRRGSIESDLQDRLLETGTIHLLSVSGLHMGIVAMVLTYVAVLLGLRPLAQVVFVGALCLAFVAITGARPPVLRAASLVGVVLLARVFGRQNSPLNSLGLAALGLMWINPTNLGQVGVQLSFLSVATLFSCGQRFSPLDEELRAESQLDRLAQSAASPLRRRLGMVLGVLANSLWFSLCVTLTTAPLVWLHFHILSPIAVLANVLLAVPMTVALISGLAAVMLGEISLWLAAPIGWVCHGALTLMHVVIEAAAEVPGGHFWLPSPPAWWVACYYLGLLAGFALPRGLMRQRSFVAGSLLWCAIAWTLATWPTSRGGDRLRATFIDVGHGTSVAINLPDGRNLLYDCGWLGNERYWSRGIEEPLWEMGLTRLDAIAISHADLDHYNALPGLLRRFSVGELIVPVGMLDSPKPGLEPVREAIARAGVRVREVSAEQRYLDDEQTIMILHPPAAGVGGKENANSLVLRFDHTGRTLVLPGDLEPPGLQPVLDLPRPPPGGLLMAPHHGSLSIDTRPVLDWARPREVIVSGGRRAERPEVEESLRVRGSGVHMTARDGAIRATLSPQGWEIRNWREQPW